MESWWCSARRDLHLINTSPPSNLRLVDNLYLCDLEAWRCQERIDFQHFVDHCSLPTLLRYRPGSRRSINLEILKGRRNDLSSSVILQPSLIFWLAESTSSQLGGRRSNSCEGEIDQRSYVKTPFTNMSKIVKKFALITGCSEGGIGASLALAYLETGRYHVFVTARNTSKIPQSLATLQDATVLALDVTSKESIAAAVNTVSKASSGRLDVLVNNSGSGLTAAALDSDVHAAKAVFEVNFFGVLATTQAFAPLLVKAKGVVVNNSSASAEINELYMGIYSASKASVTQLGEVMRLEMKPLGVRVVSVVTGVVASNFHDKQQFPELPASSYYRPIWEFLKERATGKQIEKDAMDADEYARKVVRLVDRGANGKIYVGGLAYLLKWVVWWLPSAIVVSPDPLEDVFGGLVHTDESGQDRIVLDRSPLTSAPV
ncbi:hypothetical protein AC579_9496 [Pseudocercospora musae]|uniref:Uncharacterized protein n=1 Tax=Pseudocercospora musae TaxID=113226 RepID=A0A139I5E4_9PEZI|nr:hypothetical protein AC579_9496 [Pseudocercospora musae]